MSPLLLLAGAALAQDAEILMVGNSYTARNQLPQVTADWLAQTVPAWASVSATSVTAGGKTLPEHLADADGTNGDTPLRLELVTSPAPWAFVTLQGQSQIAGFPMDEPTWQASTDAAVALAALVHDAGAEPVFFETWGRRVGDPQNPDLYPDFTAMQDRLLGGYQSWRDQADQPAWAAPVGEVFRAVHDAEPAQAATPGTDFWELYSTDGSHPSLAGTAVAAATFVATWTGRRPEPLPLLTDQGLDASRQQALLDHVAAVVLDEPDGPFPMPWLHDWTSWPDPSAVVGDIARPLVLVQDAQRTEALTVEDARLWIRPDGELEADILTLGQAAPAALRLEGALSCEALLLGPEAELDWRSGTLSTPSVSGDLALPDPGVLQIADLTQVDGALGGSGTVRWTGALGTRGEAVILIASPLEADGLTVELPPDLDWEVRGNQLVVFEVQVATRGRPGCGCAHPPSPGSLAPLPLLLLLGLRRRATLV